MTCNNLSSPTVDEVRAVLKTTVSGDVIRGFIDDAVLMVSPCAAQYPEARQRAIIKYVAAHLMASSGNGGDWALTLSSRLGDGADTFARAAPTSAVGLKSTPFGEQALALDTSGCLNGLGQRPVIVRTL